MMIRTLYIVPLPTTYLYLQPTPTYIVLVECWRYDQNDENDDDDDDDDDDNALAYLYPLFSYTLYSLYPTSIPYCPLSLSAPPYIISLVGAVAQGSSQSLVTRAVHTHFDVRSASIISGMLWLT